MTFCHSFIRFCFPQILILIISIHITSSASLSSAYQLQLSRIVYTTKFTERSEVRCASTQHIGTVLKESSAIHNSVETRTHKKEEERREGRRVLNSTFFETGRISWDEALQSMLCGCLSPELWKQSSFNVHTYLLQPQGSHITGSSTDSTQGDSTATIY